MGPKVKHLCKNCPLRLTIANIRLARGVFTMWLNPVVASSRVYQMEPAASATTPAAGRTY